MSNKAKVFIINTFHVSVYVVMVLSILYIIYAAITKTFGLILSITLGLLALEVAVFIGSGMKCPLTDLSQKYGSKNGYAFERYLSKRGADRIFNLFRDLLVISIILLAVRYFGWF